MSINQNEYKRVYESVGFFDATHAFGRVFAKGKDAIDLLHRMSTNDLKPLEAAPGTMTVTMLTNEKGRIVDALTVVRDDAGDVMLVTGAGREEALIQWLDKFTIMEDARFVTATESIAHFALYGPNATALLGNYTTIDLDLMPERSVIALTIANAPATLIESDRIAESGWWIFTSSENAGAIRDELEARMLAMGGAIISDDLYEVLRIESGIPKAPNELNEKHNPLETPLMQTAVSFTKGCYIGQEVIARLDAQGKVQRKLVGLRFDGGMPSVGDRISDPSLAGTNPLGDEIGDVTSIAVSPTFGAIGLGYVRAKHASPGSVVSVNAISATVVALPFEK